MGQMWAVRAGLVSDETRRFHRIRWYGRVGRCAEYPDGLVPRTGGMLGGDWGWDVRCSCGWQSRTGGAIEASVKRDIEDHLIDAHFHHVHVWNPRMSDFVDAEWRPLRYVGAAGRYVPVEAS